MDGDEFYAWGRTNIGGRTGIRTLERVAPLTVFKTVAFVRSATLPGEMVPACYRSISNRTMS